jgi:hypothetical protein
MNTERESRQIWVAEGPQGGRARPFLTSRKEPRSIWQVTRVREMGFLLAVFAIIEHVNKSELTPTSKKLIVIYVNEASELSMAEKARTAARRYSHIVLPTLESIREKAKTKKLDALDHLVLKMEYEASRLSR